MTGPKQERGHTFFPDLDTWFGREFPGLPGWRPATAAHAIPVEVSSGADGVCTLRAELPGMDPDDITITVDDNLITVSAEHREGTEDKDHSEFRYGAFRRTVRLPDTIPADDVDASYADGILTVRVPMPAQDTRTARTVRVKRALSEEEDRS
ncbi:Hsp20/alpha crystallin family protein [Streptomyces sp. NPDC058052]|uniref:Hsp20/alpha crystallin family protein n=1 Tax=Streptomyces sp. NPDC058052 TaxID=3346316 RepID=UPI0036EE3F99